MDSSRTITSEFKRLTKDFIVDILNTFPEYHEFFTENELEFLKTDNQSEAKLQHVFDYCLEVYPERFFDILYENDDIFKDEEKNTNFFKHIDFQDIWSTNISDNTKNVIWKYLQLILFSVTNNLNDTSCFKDTAKLFEAIDENELKDKIENVISSINEVFDISGSMNNEKSFDEMNEMFKKIMENMDMPGKDMKEKDFEEMMKKFMNKDSPMNFEEIMKSMDISGLGTDFMDMMKNMDEFKNMEENMFSDISKNQKDIPNPEDLQDHLKSLMGGKIGQLAQEIANDTAKDLDIDPDNVSNVNDVFAKLFKNPGKLMNMIKKVSSKLDEKLKSGELKETELMKEANDLVEKMKNTPGMKNMESMLSKMGLGGMGGAKGGKVNMNLFQSMMKQNIKKSSQRDRMLQKLKERKLAKEQLLKEMQKKAENTKVSQDNDSFDEYIQKTYNIENSVMKKSKINKKKKRKKKRKDKR